MTLSSSQENLQKERNVRIVVHPELNIDENHPDWTPDYTAPILGPGIVRLSSGKKCPKELWVSKEDCLDAAKKVGATDRRLSTSEWNSNGPGGCTIHPRSGNVEWWEYGSSACGKGGYDCVCHLKPPDTPPPAWGSVTSQCVFNIDGTGEYRVSGGLVTGEGDVGHVLGSGQSIFAISWESGAVYWRDLTVGGAR